MSGVVGGYLFLLGLAFGLALLALSAYARVSPRWLRWLLMAAGLFVAGRYVVTARMMMGPVLEKHLFLLHKLWLGNLIGFLLPSAFAVDALIRHPAMTPKKLLIALSPFLAAYAAIAMFSHSTLIVRDYHVGSVVSLTPGWRTFTLGSQTLFVAAFASLCLFLAKKIPVPAIRTPLLILAVSYSYLGAENLLVTAHVWDVEPSYAELLTLVALWYAFQTAARLQQSVS